MHEDQVVGLRYRETPIPLIVCKGGGESDASMLAEARQRGVPIVDDAAFVTALATRQQGR